MPLLHFRIDEADQTINLSRTLHAQNLKLKRVMIKKGDNTEFDGGLIIDCSFLKGYEIMSPFAANDFMVKFGKTDESVDKEYDLGVASEDISLAFNVKVYDFLRNKLTATDFSKDATSTTGYTPAATKIDYIDVIFEYDQLYNYDTY